MGCLPGDAGEKAAGIVGCDVGHSLGGEPFDLGDPLAGQADVPRFVHDGGIGTQNRGQIVLELLRVQVGMGVDHIHRQYRMPKPCSPRGSPQTTSTPLTRAAGGPC